MRPIVADVLRSVCLQWAYVCLSVCLSDMELGHWVTESMGHLGHLSRPSHRVIIFTRCETRFLRFSKKCPKCKTYI